MAGKYDGVIQAARGKSSKEENQISGSPETQITIKPESQESGKPVEVNLCVKVPKPLRQHWAAEAKRRGTTMTEVIVRALKAEFGEP